MPPLVGSIQLSKKGENARRPPPSVSLWGRVGAECKLRVVLCLSEGRSILWTQAKRATRDDLRG
jgi:hypothetical protein